MNVKLLRARHPDWQWTSVQSGPANNWRYEGVRGEERVEVTGYNVPKRWYVYWKAPPFRPSESFAAWSATEQQLRRTR